MGKKSPEDLLTYVAPLCNMVDACPCALAWGILQCACKHLSACLSLVAAPAASGSAFKWIQHWLTAHAGAR